MHEFSVDSLLSLEKKTHKEYLLWMVQFAAEVNKYKAIQKSHVKKETETGCRDCGVRLGSNPDYRH